MINKRSLKAFKNCKLKRLIILFSMRGKHTFASALEKQVQLNILLERWQSGNAAAC